MGLSLPAPLLRTGRARTQTHGVRQQMSAKWRAGVWILCVETAREARSSRQRWGDGAGEEREKSGRRLVAHLSYCVYTATNNRATSRSSGCPSVCEKTGIPAMVQSNGTCSDTTHSASDPYGSGKLISK